MLTYLFKRILIFIPTLIVISLVAFAMRLASPGDPINIPNSDKPVFRNDDLWKKRAYEKKAEELNLDKPAFYFNFTSAAYPDTLYKILRKDERTNIKKLIGQYGNWNDIHKFQQQIDVLKDKLFDLPDEINQTTKNKIRNTLSKTKISYKDKRITSFLHEVNNKINQDSILNQYLGADTKVLLAAYQDVKKQATPSALWVPAFRWYGFDNQYHHWFTSFLSGDFGTSFQDGREVTSKIKSALSWTLLLNFISILLAYLISIPIGVIAASKRDSIFDKTSTLITFLLFSLPSFWIATILVVFFTTPEYGNWTNIFPSIGLGKNYGVQSGWANFWDVAAHLILPVFCLTYAALAFISRQVRGGMLDVLQQDFIRTAKAKGVDDKKVIWKHAFRNSLFPIITLFAAVFPATLAGSVVIEIIFNIPGMGRLAFESILAEDWPIVFSVLMLAAILTIIGNLVADMLYAVADPRVTFTAEN